MKTNEIITFTTIALLGLISIVFPVFFHSNLKQYDAPLFPLLRAGIEGISKYSIWFLIFSGFMVKLFSDISFWKIGLMSMVLFPLASICEMFVDLSSHNMFPIEFIVYGILTIPSIIGAYISQVIKSFFIKNK
ncbi:hypothetical protein EC396_07840 [Lutibacter sp. HS1-25]|uniref:hypothetical protein n=1 Tax=Lutibacter sp. HS1-25 TaxID=2485000 RepID=UPI0010136863|nr:hypothetical protein [Lutibacter sp. HS1-25]RXP56175.1 hypothetical protein EC396_07840 [Lutibacter sp. HS1-25]